MDSVSALIANAEAALSSGGEWVMAWIDHPAVRSLGLILLVLATIRVMGVIYGGRIQNSEYGPIAIRAHYNSALTREDIRVPRSLIEMSLDGVRADCDIYYAFNDWRGKRRRVRVGRVRHARLNVMPSAIPAVQAKIDGQEITDNIGALAFEDVVIPAPEADPAATTIAATPATVDAYVRANRVLEAWTDDDNAVRISLHPDMMRSVQDTREAFVLTAADKVRRRREAKGIARLWRGAPARQRPAVIGSFYLRLRLSKNPFFILTRHPDRELKMTAWLTLLTSLFAMAMEAWPVREGRAPIAPEATHAAPAMMQARPLEP